MAVDGCGVVVEGGDGGGVVVETGGTAEGDSGDGEVVAIYSVIKSNDGSH